jgi:hypothetical protein
VCAISQGYSLRYVRKRGREVGGEGERERNDRTFGECAVA